MVWRNFTLLMSLKVSDQSVPLHLSTHIFPCTFLREDTPPIRIWTNTNHQHEYQSSLYLSLSPLVRLSLCLLNSRSVRNKSAAFFDYICECKADLVVVTETWLRCCDDAIRAELCPDGYKLLDHVRNCRQGGGTALLFRDSLTVKEVGVGAKMSFEFS